ncbi:MAG: hypothetical protein NC390_02735 [Fusobacterium sp.]|nr:hypothetical protein [Fusobacterium sp.]
MQVNRISYTNYQPQRNAQEQNFQGVRLNKLKNLVTPPRQKDYVVGFVEEIGYFLGEQNPNVAKYATFYNKDRTSFFYELTRKLRNDIYTKKIPAPENQLEVLDGIYNTVKKPKGIHFAAIQNPDYTFTESAQILKLMGNSKTNTELYTKLRNLEGIHHNKTHLPAQTVIEILSSEHAAKLNENMDTYSAFIKLNNKNENFTQELLKELAAEKPSFDVEQLNKAVKVEQTRATSYFFDKFSREDLLECYNPTAFDKLDENLYVTGFLKKHTTEFSQDEKSVLKEVIKTATPETIEPISKLLNRVENFEEKEDILRLINKFNTEKHYGNIFTNIADLQHFKISNEPLDKIMYYIDSFGSDTVNKNLRRFLDLTEEHISADRTPEETVQLISKNLKNPFYLSRRQHNRELYKENDLRNYHSFGNTKANISKAKRKIKYTLMPKIFGNGKPAEINPNATYRKTWPLPVHVPKQTPELPSIKTILEGQKEPEPLFKLEAPKPQLLLPPAKIKIKRDYKARKLQIQQDAQQIIKSRMKSAKQIQEQIGDYSKKATKMRNQFLNEMFNSVAETRAQQRAQGIKRPKVSNFDVLETYKLINGKNKKLARTLLKARNEKGERIYDIKQIAQILEKDRLEQLKLKQQAALQKQTTKTAAC